MRYLPTRTRQGLSASPLARRLHAQWILARHRLGGRPVPPPRAVKISRIRALQSRYRCSAFVETGTFKGRTLAAVRPDFQRLYSIELSPEWHRLAVERFRGDAAIELIQGNSALRLRDVLSRIQEEALLWLDGHYSGPGTASAELETPLVAELAIIERLGRRHDVILIDDARLLGSGDYPTLDRVTEQLKRINPEYRVRVVNDAVTALPPRRR